MPIFDYIFNGNPNLPLIESTFPTTPGSPSNPLLLCWTIRRILYLNIGGNPLWSALATVGPDSVIQQLSQPLLGTVIAKLQGEPINDPLCLPFVKVLSRGF
jgi:hypothetical protein